MYNVTYKIWDKKEPINGVDAQLVLESMRIKEDDEIFLIINTYDHIDEIQFVNTIKSNYKLDKSLSAEETAQAYIKIREEEQKRQEENNEVVEGATFGERINTLEHENADLLLDSVKKDERINTLEQDLADLTLDILNKEVVANEK